ncbi:MAG: Rid family hydrolase, partial [Spirillospora sp.]
MKQFLPGPFADDEAPFSAGVDLGDLVYADASALDPATMRRVPEAASIADETRVCLRRLAETLGQVGCGLGDVVKVNCYL